MNLRGLILLISVEENSVSYGAITQNVPPQKGWIYLWVIEKQEEPVLILYVGQTTIGILSRMKEHESGGMLKKNNIPRSEKHIPDFF